jgi:hypothetical protein
VRIAPGKLQLARLQKRIAHGLSDFDFDLARVVVDVGLVVEDGDGDALEMLRQRVARRI